MKKNLSVQVLTIALFVCCFCLELIQSVQFAPEAESESFRNLILANSHLLLGSSEAVYRLDGSLLEQEKRVLGAPNRMLVTDYVGSFQDNVLICSNNGCFLSQITDFSNVSWQVNSPFFRTSTTENVVGVFAPRANGTSDLTFGETSSTDGSIMYSRFLAKGSLFNAGANIVSSDYSFLEYARKEEAISFGDPRFYLTEFPLRYANDSGYVYFVTRPAQDEMRIVRFCEDDGGFRNQQFISHFEAVIRCGNSGSLARDSTTATFINITNSIFNGRPTVLVTQTRIMSMSNVQLEVCSFDIGTINFIMSQKFNDCVDGVNQATSGFERDGPLGTCNAVNPDARSQVSECSLPGTARPGLEIVDPHVQQPILSYPLNSVATSITHTTLDGALFMFAATANRTLLEFHIPNPSVANLVRTIDLPITLVENVTKMVTSDNGEYIFAMTPSKLFRHSVDMCNDFTSCTECTTSVDPICGWCPLSGLCTRQSNCANVPPLPDPIWLNDSTTCPSIAMIDPAIVYIPELSNVIMFNLTTTNIETSSLSSFGYNCQYYFRNTNSQPVTTSATRSGAVFTCNSPPSDLVPQLPSGQDTLDTMISLAVVDSGVTIASLELFIPFTDCDVHVSRVADYSMFWHDMTGFMFNCCTSCIGGSRCEWCPFSFKCIQPGTTCSDTSPPEQTVANGGVCPQILPSSATGEYLIHANHNYQEFPLRINSSDLRQFETDFNNERFKCELCSQDDMECNSPLFSTPASLSEDGFEVLCERTMYESMDKTPALSARLRVVWNGERMIDNPQNASVILYSCSLMGTNCGQCLAQESRFECSYCVRSNPSSSQGNCQLQTTCSVGSGYLSFIDPQDIQHCPTAQITNFEPKSGPTRGGTTVTIYGTNLGARRQDIVSVMIDGVNCNVTDYTPGISITCETGTKQASIITDRVSINFGHLQENIFSQDFFNFVAPALDSKSPASPNSGPQSGGTSITLMGTNIGSGSRHRVLVGGKECEVTDVQQDRIVCTTSRSDTISSNNELLQLFVDNWEQELAGFSYIDDPTFSSISPNSIILSGGMNYTITGTNLNSVQEPRLLIYYEVMSSGSSRRRRQINLSQEGSVQSEPCLVNRMTGTTMYCTAPRLNNDEFNQTNRPLRIGLLMDGVSSLLELENTSLTLYEDPTFDMFEEELIFPSGDPIFIFIQGSGFIFEPDQVTVQIDPCNNADSTVCQCSVEEVFQANNTIRCTIDIIRLRELPTSQSLMISVAVGNLIQSVGTIRIQNKAQLEILYYLIPVFAVVIVVAIVIFMVLIAVFCRKARQKDRKYDQLILELEKLESSVARECKIGFAELQTDLDELTGDVVGCRLPYRDLQNYLLTTLFPGARSHPVLEHLQCPNHQRALVDRSLKDFGNLLLDKRSLLVFIRSMEEQRGFTIRDKSIVGSLLIVALHNRLDYATDVLKSLLSELIRRTVQNSYPKLLLRRTESVAEKMLTNWLAFCLHGYVMEHVGQPMYLLYRAVKNQLEKGPIDVITGEARYSLSEQKLIRQKVEVVQLDATVEMEDGLRIPVKLLDCDTISQAKEKMLDAVHKAAPVSQRPSLTHVDLQYVKSANEMAVLRDEDSTTVKEGEWKKINTLKHYWVKDGAVFRLISRRDYAPPGRTYDYPGSLISSHTPRQRALSEAEDGTRVWHLFKQLDMEDPKRSPFMNKKLVSEIYLPRMLSTKSILQKFADDLFHSLFSISHPPASPTGTYMAVYPNSPGVQVPMGYAPGADAVPMAVKYLFDFLDDEAEAVKIFDPDVVHTWKNNALSLRFWVNLIKNPEFVFDINKSHTVDACLSVIAQAFIDGCSSSEMKLTIDSPTSKLLYNKEVQGYKTEVKQYYEDVRHLPRIPEDAMQYYLRQLSSYQSQQMKRSGGFVTDSALHELLRYAGKYQEPFLLNLRASGLESRAQQFEGVMKVYHQID